MSEVNYSINYNLFIKQIDVLNLPISGSELHGVICGYLSAGAISEGERYLRALVAHKKKDPLIRKATIALFELFSYSQEQLTNNTFTFTLMLPDDNTPLKNRAKAFGEWCEGFIQGFTLSGINQEHLEADCQEVLHHIQEFAQLDYDKLSIDEEDEKSLMEVSEYTRTAVIQLSYELRQTQSTTH